MEEPIAKARREAIHATFDPEPLITRIKELLKKHNESYREASLRSGLDHQAIRRILSGQKPQMHVCILLADHFGVNPNEMLHLAGWPTLKAFDVSVLDAVNLPPEATEVALAVAKISEPGVRREVTDAILILMKKYFTE
ncbi:MAG TPA: helix-turn-helix transcriptional regulator [Bellilinea sp.]|nr:helix-turn-helix transcriptional regulator [Bellilinea sp.]